MKKNKQNATCEAKLTQAFALQQRGDLAGALVGYEEVLRLDPKNPDALHLSGVIANQQGRFDDALALLRQAAAVRPAMPMYHVNLANALENKSLFAEAEAALRRALALDPAYAPAWYNLGNLLVRASCDAEAIQCYDRAVAINPAHFPACLALGQLLLKNHRAPQATQLALMALRLRPESEPANDLLIGSLLKERKFGAALERIERILFNAPDSIDALRCKAQCLSELAQIESAISTYRKLLQVNSDQPHAVKELARALIFAGRIAEGIDLLRPVVESHRDDAALVSIWLFFLNYDERYSAVELCDLHRSFERGLSPVAFPLTSRAPVPKPRLKIGYLSSDFKTHSVAFFIEPVIAAHDRNAVEVHAYYRGTAFDAVTARIRAGVDQFIELQGKTPDEIAQKIAEDGIDIVIDLGGHTDDLLLDSLRRRPAPVQMTWLGYPNTTGLSSIDYRISDAVADPVGEGDTWNSEQLIRLPDCFHCYRPVERVPFDPAPAVARTGAITFGSFNVLSKLSDSCLAAWARIVCAVPGSRLFIKTRYLRDPYVRQGILDRITQCGLEPARVILEGDQSGWAEHMQRYREIDIALDPFPYNGTTTTCEALWMGVPVVTFAGNRHAGRVGASLMNAIGHPELVAAEVGSYVDLAVALASNPDQLRHLHQRLHGDLAGSPLCDAPRFVANLEAAYRQVWQRACST